MVSKNIPVKKVEMAGGCTGTENWYVVPITSQKHNLLVINLIWLNWESSVRVCVGVLLTYAAVLARRGERQRGNVQLVFKTKKKKQELQWSLSTYPIYWHPTVRLCIYKTDQKATQNWLLSIWPLVNLLSSDDNVIAASWTPGLWMDFLLWLCFHCSFPLHSQPISHFHLHSHLVELATMHD